MICLLMMLGNSWSRILMLVILSKKTQENSIWITSWRQEFIIMLKLKSRLKNSMITIRTRLWCRTHKSYFIIVKIARKWASEIQITQIWWIQNQVLNQWIWETRCNSRLSRILALNYLVHQISQLKKSKPNNKTKGK